ncbi:MAG: hypothetical protein HY537_12305 [Deltaproteobacteria bacterium]|nr:hypothetical protein [Deltaproteobacteria bacterium]
MFFAVIASAGDPPIGFDEETLGKVMAGQIVTKELVGTKNEFRHVIRAYFNKVSSDAYIGLATDHPRYATLFPEVKEGKTLKVNDTRTEFDFWLHLDLQYGPYTIPMYPELHQTVFRAPDQLSEARIQSELSNYKDEMDFGMQKTRLIPYETGMLVEEDIHFKAKEAIPTASLVKQELLKFYSRYVDTFRRVLQGGY